MSAIERCRTAALGGHVVRAEGDVRALIKMFTAGAGANAASGNSNGEVGLERIERLNDERPDHLLRHPAQGLALRAVVSALSWIMPLTRIGINLEPCIRRCHFPFFAILVESGN
jgi:hypothetical protein